MSQIDNFDIKGCITGALTETIRAMLAREIEPAETDPAAEPGAPRMVGTLSFAGAVNGIFSIQADVAFGRVLVAGQRGVEPGAGDPTAEIRDLLAGITGSVGASLQSALSDAGYPCLLSTPSIIHGTDFSLRSPGTDRFERFVFRQSEHALIVEVGLKAAAGAEAGAEVNSPEAMRRPPDVDLARLSALEYRAKVSAAAVEVFDTMFSLRLEAAENPAAEGLSGSRTVSSVCFAGDAAGIVSIHAGEALSRRMAARMLDMEPEEIEGQEEVQDLLGELGNIVAGNVKSALTETGLRLALSTPSLITGRDFTIETPGLERHERCAFTCEGQPVVVDLGVRIDERVKAADPAGKKTRDAPAGRDTPQAGPEPRTKAAPAPAAAPASAEELGLEILLDIPVELTVELGRTRMQVQELLRLAPGSAVKLANLEGEPVDILANDVLIARGEVVVSREKYGIRITEITSRVDRLKGLK